ncbi:MAG: hypothetical protein NTV43_14350 [Methylococcales bacterium]|nr:hypothetical protein [Methylococcales bacterium]
MGFKDARQRVIACLKSGNVKHEIRNGIDIKNLLATGELDAEELAAILRQAKGNEHQSSPHHCAASIEVHIVKTKHSGRNWS